MYERRIKSIELFRVISIIAVILIHTTPFSASGPLGERLDLATILNQLARFAVPFFSFFRVSCGDVKSTQEKSWSALP